LPDAGVLALALRAAQLQGMSDAQISEFFEREFGLAGLDSSTVDTCISILLLMEAERGRQARIKARRVGRN
jgi:hypothetical protein